MTPFDLVLQRYKFPDFIVPEPLQIDAINQLAVLDNEGFWLDMGTGKTYCSTVVWLYQHLTRGKRWVVVMPPLLIKQWMRWLRSITDKVTGRPISVVDYRGTPAERRDKQAALTTCQVVLVGIQIFKKEYAVFQRAFGSEDYFFTVDEPTATGVSGLGSDAHDKCYEFSVGHSRALLCGNPSDPGYAYPLAKFTAPGSYRNFKHYENMHVDERDFFGNVISWKNLDVLAGVMKTNSVRILYGDIYKDVDAPLFDPLPYDLEPAHQKLYRKLAEEEMLKVGEGKLDATTQGKLVHALGQIVCSWGHFSGDPKDVSNAYKLVQQKLDELGKKKLVVFTNYRLTVAQLVAQFAKEGAVFVNGDATPAQKERAVDRFIEDPSCRLIVIQFKSGGFGLDGLQHVCHHMMFLEPCTKSTTFHQCVARLRRKGQKNRVWVGLAIANKTNQPRGFINLLSSDAIANQVIRSEGELRAAIFGEDEIDWSEIKQHLAKNSIAIPEAA
jgi:hypothetical protein